MLSKRFRVVDSCGGLTYRAGVVDETFLTYNTFMEFEKIISASALCVPEHGKGLTVSGELLASFAEEAFKRLSFTYPQEHLEALTAIVFDPAASENDRLVAVKLLENAVIAARGQLPLCQDTGVAQVFAWKDTAVAYSPDTAGSWDSETAALTFGVGQAYKKNNLRFSINIPSSLFDERNSATNLPAQIDIFSTHTPAGKEPACRFLFCSKGGGSSNKTDFTCATKALLNPRSFETFLRTKIAALGTAACPPYTIAVVIGGLSPEQNLLTLKLATTGYWDAVEQAEGGSSPIYWPDTAGGVRPLRCPEWEETIIKIAAETGLGAQFGGIHLAAHARVFRLPRHGASCFASIGVSCNAHRNLLGYICREGAFLQKNISDPQPFLDKALNLSAAGTAEAFKPVAVNIRSISSVCAELSQYKVGQAFAFSGDILVARDAAHARVFRLPRHGASCFASIGVSCNAHRNLLGYICREGAFLQQNITDPQPFLEKALNLSAAGTAKAFQPVAVNLHSIPSVCAELSQYNVGQAFAFSGDILVARDAAHARWKTLIDQGKNLPDYTLRYPILYAGPAETPQGAVIGSFGPTTANRMDPYADELMSRGAALITIAKGNRSEGWRTACKKYGAFYLGTIGGAAALIAEKHITSCRIIDYPDLGMEAVHLISVKDMPVFLITDDKGNDFYAELKQ